MNYHLIAMDPGGDSNPLGMFLPLILMFAIFYFMIIRPQSKRQKEREKLLSNVQKGDKVVTSGGVHGTVSSVDETTVIVQVADNVKLKIDKVAITTVLPAKGSETPATTK